MIAHVPSLFDHTKVVKVNYQGQLIDHIVERYPNGWPTGFGRVFVNRVEIAVDDYDIEVTNKDEVVIVTAELHDPVSAGLLIGTVLISWSTVASIVLTLLSAIMTASFAKKGQSVRGGGDKKVYSISGAQNQPALGEVIAEHFGKVWFYPDVASQPYSRFINNDQWLYQILLLGAGEFRIDGITFGNTQLSLIPTGLVEYQVFGPTDHKSQYGVIETEFGVSEDVVSSEDVQGLDFSRNGQDSWGGQAVATNALKGNEYPTGFAVGDVVMLLGRPGWAMHRTTKTITVINGNFVGFTSTIEDAHWYQIVKVVGGDDGWRGWFNTLPTGKTTDKLELDFEFPRGLVYIDNEGRLRNQPCWINVEIQEIDDDDLPVGSVITKYYYYNRNTRDPLRFSQTIPVTPGRYKVRCIRDDQDDVNGHAQSSVGWTGLKAYAINTFGQYAYGDVTLIAIKMKASAALSSTSDKISVQATRKLPTVASDFLTIEATINSVDSFASIVRDSDPNGIDLPSLKVLGTKWAGTNGFNYRFADQTTVFEALQVVAAGHRATPEGYAKLLSMREDVPKPYDQYIVTEENMLKDTYSCGVRLGNEDGLIDGYRVAYNDPTAPRVLYVVIPSGAVTPEDFELNGCTDKATAVAMGNYLWAKRSALRRAIEFQTEWDANVYSIGDRISVLQNLIDTVRTARIVSHSGVTIVIDAIYPEPTQLKLRLRDEFGEPSELLNGTIVGDVITLDALPPFELFGADSGQDQTTVVLGTTTSFSKSYIVNTIEPNGDSTTVTASTYSDAPYAYPIPGALP